MKFLLFVICLAVLFGCEENIERADRTFHDERGEYIDIQKGQKAFLVIKDVYCSEDPFAKDLVKKYGITGEGVECG